MSSGVDLRWNLKEDFMKLSKEQRDELINWLRIDDGNKQKSQTSNRILRIKDDPRREELMINLVVKNGRVNFTS